MSGLQPLRAAALRWQCDAAAFDFETSADLADLDDVLGQERALAAVRFGIGMRREGYNLFVLGPPGTGKHTVSRRFIEAAAAGEPVAPDLCYVNNFSAPQKPRAMHLPAGRGAALKADMAALIDDLRGAIPATFESDEYRTRRQVIDSEFKERHEKVFGEIQKRAGEKGIAVLRTPMGLALAPMKDGEVANPEEFRTWPESEQNRVQADMAAMNEELQGILRDMPQWERERREKLRALNRDVTTYVVGNLMGDLRGRYADLAETAAYLDAVQQDIVENASDFVPQETGAADAALPFPIRGGPGGAPSFRRYEINLLVSHDAASGAPAVYENHPNHANLIGRIEHQAEFGALFTDFNLIRPGALHRANGGYLMLDARKVLMQPFVWEELKRALSSREIRIESPAEMMGLAAPVSLDPEPVPLDVKIVLVGDRALFYLLSQLDPDFPELFKVAADFGDRIDRSPEAITLYARLIATLARRDSLRPLDRGGVARVIEHGARLAEDSEKLTVHMRSIADLLRESDYWAEDAGRPVIGAGDVDRAIDAKIYRLDRVRERIHEGIRRGTILIDTAGAVTGQVNGLSVLQLGDFSFGQPSRITARIRMGRGEVVDIEREVQLGGPLHSKGVLILAGFLGGRFAAERPLSLSASLVFEQSYGGVDGDSASSPELYALLSALADLPIKQCFAVTGSVNQHGRVQAIGGVNQKIEGFFDVCQARGLDGEQGVLIPESNVKHLMLRADVVAAVAENRFHIHPVATIDAGIEILTGVAAGERGVDGKYPEDTVNQRIEARLAKMAAAARSFGRRPDDRGDAA